MSEYNVSEIQSIHFYLYANYAFLWTNDHSWPSYQVAASQVSNLLHEVKHSLKFLHYGLEAFPPLDALVDLVVNCYGVITGLLPSMLRNMPPLYLTLISGEVLVDTRYNQPYNNSFLVNLNSNYTLWTLLWEQRLCDWDRNSHQQLYQHTV